MKKLTITFITIALMYGCANLPKNYVSIGHKFTGSDEYSTCQDLYENISKKWGHHTDFKTCYFYNEKLVSSMVQSKNCFIGLNEVTIKQIFGEPSTTTENSISYTMSKTCSEVDTLFSSKSLRFRLANKDVSDVKIQEADVHY